MLHKMRGHQVKSFALSVFSIIVGLTISFMIDEWRSERKLREKEISILNSIREDLEADINDADNALERLALKQTLKRGILNNVYRDSDDSCISSWTSSFTSSTSWETQIPLKVSLPSSEIQSQILSCASDYRNTIPRSMVKLETGRLTVNVFRSNG